MAEGVCVVCDEYAYLVAKGKCNPCYKRIWAQEQNRGTKGIRKAVQRNAVPWRCGRRRLLCRTCIKCGLLLGGEFFKSKGPTWRQHCVVCDAEKQRLRPGRETDLDRMEGMRLRRDELQEISKFTARRGGMPWTKKDISTLYDDSLSSIDKAFALERSYRAILHALKQEGLTRSPLDPQAGQWSISFPCPVQLTE